MTQTPERVPVCHPQAVRAISGKVALHQVRFWAHFLGLLIGTLGVRMNVSHSFGQLFLLTAVFRRWMFRPGILATPGNFQDFTHGIDWVIGQVHLL